MTDEEKKVIEAWETIKRASPLVKRKAFRNDIAHLRAAHINIIKSQRANLHDISWPVGFIASDVLKYVEHLLGYDPHQIFRTITPYLNDNKTGRPQKYSSHERLAIGTLIEALVNNGATPTQAMKLIMRINGDMAMTEGHLRIMRSIYKDYKDYFKNENYESRISMPTLIYLQDYNECDLISDELASHKAKDAFLVTWPKVAKACAEKITFIESESLENQNTFKKITMSKDKVLIEMLFHEKEALKNLLFFRHRSF